MKLEDFTKDSISCKNTTIEPFGDRLILKEPISTSKISLTAKEAKIMFDKHVTADKVELMIGDDFEVKEEDGKWFVVKKQIKYPKTYKECCKVLGINSAINCTIGYRWELLCQIQELLICRDAYWKLAEDWEPDWSDNKTCYYAIKTCKNDISLISTLYIENCILVFPTKEMRDAFYENFKKVIELCKELL